MRTLTFHVRFPALARSRPPSGPRPAWRRSDCSQAAEAEHFEVHSIAGERLDVTEGTGTGIGPPGHGRYDWSDSGCVSVFASPRQPDVRRPGPCPQPGSKSRGKMLVLPARDWHRDEHGAKARRAPALAGKTRSVRTEYARPAWRRTTRPRARWRRRARPGVAGARQVESSLLLQPGSTRPSATREPEPDCCHAHSHLPAQGDRA